MVTPVEAQKEVWALQNGVNAVQVTMYYDVNEQLMLIKMVTYHLSDHIEFRAEW